MGISPKMYLVFGVDDFTGGIDDDKMERKLYLPETIEDPWWYVKDAFYDKQEEEWGYIYEYLYFSSEWSPTDDDKRIVGAKTKPHRYFGADIVRALSVFHEEYEVSGKKDIPILDPNDNPLLAKRVYWDKMEGGDWTKHLPECGDIVFQWSWFYDSVIEQHSMWPIRAYTTRWLLQQAGIEIDYHSYKAMLVWEWS